MSIKRYYKANEVEAMMQMAREKDGFTGRVEINSIRTMLETAKRNGRIGDKVLLVIPTKYIHIPNWQRKMDMERARKIGLSYNRYKWEVPKVIEHEGKLYCVDGMHRIVGAFVGNIEDIVVEILTEMSELEAIELFLNQTADRSNMKPHDYYNASLKLNKPEYITFRDICHRNNVQIKGDDTLRNPIGTFSSLSDGVKMSRLNPELLNSIIELICKLQWNGNAGVDGNLDKCFGAKYIRTLRKLYGYYNGHEKEMETVLLKDCNGTDWFNKYAVDESQAKLFDKLSKIITDGMKEIALEQAEKMAEENVVAFRTA